MHREIWRGTAWLASPGRRGRGPAGAPRHVHARRGCRSPSRRARTAARTRGPGRSAWTGHGVLVLRRPGEAYSVWHFWEGPERRFAGWYLNFEEPFRRTAIGYDTQDLELDIWIPVGGTWRFKDERELEERVREGRYTEDQVAATRRSAASSARCSTAASAGGTSAGRRSSPSPAGARRRSRTAGRRRPSPRRRRPSAYRLLPV